MRERSTSEKVIERLLCDLVKEHDGLCIKLVPIFMSGLPDRLVLMPNKVIAFVETKSTGIAARPLQKVVHKMIRKLGFDVYVPDTTDEVRELVQKLAILSKTA